MRRLVRGIVIGVVALSLLIGAATGWCAWRVDEERYDAVLFIGGGRFVQWYPRMGQGWRASTGLIWISKVQHDGVVGPRWLDRYAQFYWLTGYREDQRRVFPLGVWVVRGTTRLPEDGAGNVLIGPGQPGDEDDGPPVRFWLLTVPLWMCLGVLGMPGIWVASRGLARRWRRRARVAAGRCVACGYDLRGTPGRCPECGREVGGERKGEACRTG